MLLLLCPGNGAAAQSHEPQAEPPSKVKEKEFKTQVLCSATLISLLARAAAQCVLLEQPVSASTCTPELDGVLLRRVQGVTWQTATCNVGSLQRMLATLYTQSTLMPCGQSEPPMQCSQQPHPILPPPLQLDELKERATAMHHEAIQHAQQVAFGSIRTGAGGEDAAALRGRLEAAITAMQEGLVERDVEVGGSGGGDAVAGWWGESGATGVGWRG